MVEPAVDPDARLAQVSTRNNRFAIPQGVGLAVGIQNETDLAVTLRALGDALAPVAGPIEAVSIRNRKLRLRDSSAERTHYDGQ